MVAFPFNISPFDPLPAIDFSPVAEPANCLARQSKPPSFGKAARLCLDSPLFFPKLSFPSPNTFSLFPSLPVLGVSLSFILRARTRIANGAPNTSIL